MEKIIEIALAVPYELEINSNEVNLEKFECYFAIETDGVNLHIPLKQKGKEYILKIPKDFAFIANKPWDYKILVTHENAIFCASKGKMKIMNVSEDNFTVSIKEPKKKDTEKAKKEKVEEVENVESSEIHTTPITEQAMIEESESKRASPELLNDESPEKDTTPIKRIKTKPLSQIMEERKARKDAVGRKREINQKLLGFLKENK